ncbi:MAG: XisH family protein [Gemmataceae bacterium]|nr:XisH family protein [Gemmataceae bacterium]
MPARDTYHDTVRNALVKDGWTITDDPLRLKWGDRDFFVDLAAERILVAAQKGGTRIAVETKCFLGDSPMTDLQRALGQFVLYRSILEKQEPGRALFLAVPLDAAEIFDEPIGELVIAQVAVQLMVFDVEKEEIMRWIP